MTKSTQELEISERARELVRVEFDHTGRFTLLEKQSGIGASKWKNFFYVRQSASTEMVDFLCKKFPERASWIKAGESKAPFFDSSFHARAPSKQDGGTVRTRLKWVIREWAAPRGARLFSYLAARTNGEISESDWESFFVDDTEPSAAMIVAGCESRRMFSEWVLYGSVSKTFEDPDRQVDPTDPESVKNWKNARARWQEGWTQSALADTEPFTPHKPDQG